MEQPKYFLGVVHKVRQHFKGVGDFQLLTYDVEGIRGLKNDAIISIADMGERGGVKIVKKC